MQCHKDATSQEYVTRICPQGCNVTKNATSQGCNVRRMQRHKNVTSQECNFTRMQRHKNTTSQERDVKRYNQTPQACKGFSSHKRELVPLSLELNLKDVYSNTSGLCSKHHGRGQRITVDILFLSVLQDLFRILSSDMNLIVLVRLKVHQSVLVGPRTD